MASTLVMIIVLTISLMFTGLHEASAQPVVVCHLQNTVVLCSLNNKVVYSQPITLPTVTIPSIRVVVGPTHTVTTTKSVTIKSDGPQTTKTITLPAQTDTVTTTVSGSSTSTPNSESTVTAKPGKATVTVFEPGQVKTKYVKISPPPPDKSFLEGPVKKIVVGGLSLIVAIIFVILALWGGYILGHRDADKNNNDFLRALRDRIIQRKRN